MIIGRVQNNAKEILTRLNLGRRIFWNKWEKLFLLVSTNVSTEFIVILVINIKLGSL